jgi:hypothetical protein
VGVPEGMRTLRRLGQSKKNNFKMHVKEIGWKSLDLNHLSQVMESGGLL